MISIQKIVKINNSYLLLFEMPTALSVKVNLMSTIQIFKDLIIINKNVFNLPIDSTILAHSHRSLQENLQIIQDLLLHCCLCQRVSTSFLLIFIISCCQIDFA